MAESLPPASPDSPASPASSAPGSVARRAILSAALVLLALAAGGLAFVAFARLREPPARADEAPPRIAVRARALAPGPYRERLAGYGQARALAAAEVTAEVAGRVVLVDPRLEAGAAVAPGAPLVQIDDRDLAHAYAQADARVRALDAALAALAADEEALARQLAVGRADLATARADLARTADLVGKKWMPDSALDQQRMATGALERQVIQLDGRAATLGPERERLAAERAAADAQRAKAALDRSRASVEAPFAGRVEARYVSAGAWVTPGAPLFRLLDPGAVEVAVALPASRFGEVAVGARARVRLREGAPWAWEGPVARISPAIDPRDRTFTVYLVARAPAGAAVPAADRAAAPVPAGAFVLAEVDGRLHEDVVAVPRRALLGDVLFVAVPAPAGAAASRGPAGAGTAGALGEAWIEERRVDALLLPEVALVRAGLARDERVVLTNLEQIAAGSRVRIVEDDEAIGAAEAAADPATAAPAAIAERAPARTPAPAEAGGAAAGRAP